MGYHLEPSLTVANVGPHTLGTFERHPHLGGQSFPSVLFLRLIDLVIGTFQASAQMPPRGIYSDVTLPHLTLPYLNKLQNLHAGFF